MEIIVALDLDNLKDAKKLVKLLYPKVKIFKIGLEFINTGKAPELIKFINKLGGKVFYDIKLNDIPNTTAKSVRVISKLGVWAFTIHASSGPDALRVARINKGKSKVIGVTVLTSLIAPKSKVQRLAEMLALEGADGIVCSAQDVSIFKNLKNLKKLKNLKIIAPGIRPIWARLNDQKRISTPSEAIRAGADYLVVGRPITAPPKNIGNSLKALQLIQEEIETKGR